MKYLRSLSVVLCACFFSFSVFAQAPAGSSTQSEPENKKKELEQKALARLDDLIESSHSLRLPENRCHILSTAADLLWRYDEKRAVELLREAMNIFLDLIRQPEGSPEAIPENYRWYLWQQRHQMVEMLAQHDPQLAMDFLIASRQAADTEDSRFDRERDDYLEMAVAQQIAAKDPRRALRHAEELLAAGKSLQLVTNLLKTLHEKDFDTAKKLMDLLLARLQAESPLSID